MKGKYDPLYDFLIDLPSDIGEITLTFKQVEGILAKRLPQSAYTYRPWWGNERSLSGHSQARAWMKAGWEVETVNQQDDWVRFRRSS